MKSLKKIPWSPLRLLAIVVVLGCLMSFASYRNNARRVGKIDIHIDHPEQPFITAETVNKLLIEKHGVTLSKHKVDLVLNNLERTIRNLPSVKNAEVSVLLDGRLQVEVTQRLPVGRVFVGQRSYYVDAEGATMPLSDTYTAHVPLVYTETRRIEHPAVGQLLACIQKDSFLKTNITSVTVLDGTRFVLGVRDQTCRVYVGKLWQLERKFNNYKAFYQKAMKDGSIRQYKWVNLVFSNQVVCVK